MAEEGREGKWERTVHSCVSVWGGRCRRESVVWVCGEGKGGKWDHGVNVKRGEENKRKSIMCVRGEGKGRKKGVCSVCVCAMWKREGKQE